MDAGGNYGGIKIVTIIVVYICINMSGDRVEWRPPSSLNNLFSFIYILLLVLYYASMLVAIKLENM